MRGPSGSHSLVDVLDRILDKGLVVAGDIKVSLADVELLTVRIRLVICSVDKAEAIGLDWWRSDPSFSSLARPPEPPELPHRTRELAERVERIDARLEALLSGRREPPAPSPKKRPPAPKAAAGGGRRVAKGPAKGKGRSSRGGRTRS